MRSAARAIPQVCPKHFHFELFLSETLQAVMDLVAALF
jgi:hypothetical protein